MAYGEVGDLSTLNVYNMSLGSDVTSRSPSVQSAPSTKSRPASAKTDPKTGRLTQGKRIRPSSSHRSTKNEQILDYGVPRITTCQPYYDHLPPTQQRPHQTLLGNQGHRYSPVEDGQSHAAPPRQPHFLYQEDELRVPCSTPQLTLEDEFNESEGKHQSSRYCLQNVQSQRTSLNLSLPDADYSADEDDEIDTLRLLGDLNINIGEGTASVTITPQLKARLAATSAANDSADSSPCSSKNAGEGNFNADDELKFDMKRNLQDLLHQHRENTTSAKMRQSRDCWVGTQKSVANEEVNEREDSSLSSSPVDQEGASLDELPETVGPNVEIQSKLSGHASSEVTHSIDKLTTNHEGTTSTKIQSAGDQTQSSHVDNLLYRWNIDVTDTFQVEVPLVDGRKNYEEIDDEINRRVQQIEQELANEIAESQQAIDQLETDASNTEFRIPEFCEIENKVEQPQLVKSENRPGSKAFKLHRADVNVQQQAKKLGLKHRDVTNVFRAVTPRHKKSYVTSGQGKVKVTNVTSRVNSGLKRKKSQNQGKTIPQQMNSTQPAALHITGNRNLNAEPEESPIEFKMAESMKSNKAKSVTFSDVGGKKPRKVIKTLALGQDGSVQVDTTVSQYGEKKAASTQYKIPDEVGMHLKKCVKKPPPRPQSTNRLLPSSQPTNQKSSTSPPTNQQLSSSQLTNPKTDQRAHSANDRGRPQRVKSAPTHRKLSRERSAERKLLNGFNSRNVREEDSKISLAKDLGIANRRPQETGTRPHNDDVQTAVELVDKKGGRVEEVEYSLSANEQHQGGLSGVSTSTRNRPFSAHPQPKTQEKLTGMTRRAKSAPVRRRVVPHAPPTKLITTRKYIQREDPDEIESITQVHDRVTQLGGELDKSTLDRALLPPAQQSVFSCQSEMGKHFYTSGLLSSPDKWLREEFKKMEKAKQEILRYQRAKGRKC